MQTSTESLSLLNDGDEDNCDENDCDDVAKAKLFDSHPRPHN